MAMNTTVNAGNIGQVSQSNPTIKSNPRIVTNDSYSPFQPETHVDLENSLKSMLGTLEKTALGKSIQTEGLPQEVQKMVETLLRNAFSLENSLSQGLSDVLQSQRFTLDQLKLLSKFLDQVGVLLENNKIDTLPDALKLLLGNVDMALGEDGKLLEGMQLNKLAYQLLEGKSITDLPEALQFLLLQNTGSLPASHAPQSAEANFLKQLVQFFMPSQAGEEEAASNVKQPQGQTGAGSQTAQSKNAQSQTAAPSQGAKLPAAGTNNAGTTGAPAGQGQQSAGVQPQANAAPPPQSANPQQNAAANSNPSLQQSGSKAPAGMQQTGSQAQGAAENGQGGQNLSKAGMQAAQANGKNQAGLQAQREKGDFTAKNVDFQGRTVLKNTPQAMQAMKNLASYLLKSNNFTEGEINLLKNFINGSQKVLNDKEVKQLQSLIRLGEENIPAAVRQAAIQQDLPNLPKLWAFVQLCNLTQLLDLQANRLRKAGKEVNDFATVLKKSLHNENEVSGGQRTMSFMTPLYLGDNEKCYPTYIHVYDESTANGEEEEEKKETWLRLCMLTEYIGAVELVFRLYEKNNVSLRVSFSEAETVDSFNEFIPELRSAFEEFPLVLNDIKVSAIGE